MVTALRVWKSTYAVDHHIHWLIIRAWIEDGVKASTRLSFQMCDELHEMGFVMGELFLLFIKNYICKKFLIFFIV